MDSRLAVVADCMLDKSALRILCDKCECQDDLNACCTVHTAPFMFHLRKYICHQGHTTTSQKATNPINLPIQKAEYSQVTPCLNMSFSTGQYP